MNKWIKKKKVTVAAMTAIMALGVSAMSPLPERNRDIPVSNAGINVASVGSLGKGLTTPSSLSFDPETDISRMSSLPEGVKTARTNILLGNRTPTETFSIFGVGVGTNAVNYGLENELSIFSLEDGTEPQTADNTEPQTIDNAEPQTTDNAEPQTAEEGNTNTEDNENQTENDSDYSEPVPEFLSIGMDHPIIAQLQQRLMELGFMDYAEPTEHFGPITQTAIMLFQRQNGLTQDGIVGPMTLETILSSECKAYTVFLGMQGEDVTRIQNRLYEMGYLPTADMVTGYFGDVTEAAIKKMQEINGLAADGKVGTQTINLLYSEDIKPNFLSYGEKSDVVKAGQERLKELGYLTTTPDGVYGSDTAAAVKQFQSRNDLVVDGFLGPSTRNVLNSSNAVPNGLSLGDRGDTVMRVQELLSKYGYISASNTTGYFGEITEEAVKAFQKNNGLTADGNVGMRTMAVLTSGEAKSASSGNSSSSSSSSNTSSSSGSSNKGSSNSSSSSKPGNSSSSNSSSNSGSSNKGSSGSTSSGSGAVNSSIQELIRVAKSKVGSPYVLGAKGPNAFDCSGFVYWCLNQVGIKQSYTTSYGWRNIGKYMRISNFSDIKAGDIVVVYGHVGIAAGNGMVVDASSSSGKIVYRDLGAWWKNNFIVAWRIFG